MPVDPRAALSGLRSAVDSLLSGVSFERVLLSPKRVKPAGIGGFVRPSRSPAGDVDALQVDAVAQVTVQGNDTLALDTASQNVITALMGAERSALVPMGIQRITLAESGPPLQLQGNLLERQVSFSVLYEFAQAPTQAGGIIAEIPIELRTPDGTSGAIVDTEFMEGSLAWFEVVDDALADQASPSDWRYEAPGRQLSQRSLIRGGDDAANENKPGTYLVLRSGPQRPLLRDFVLEANIRSEAGGGLGFVFRYQNPFEFYFFVMDSVAGYRVMGRRHNAGFSALETDGLDAAGGFPSATDLQLRLEVSGPSFRVLLDGTPILSGLDSTLVGPGRVGFLARGNDAALFRSLVLVPG